MAQAVVTMTNRLAGVKVDELLKEVRVDYFRTRLVDSAVSAVRDVLLGLAEEEVGSSLADATIQDLGIPSEKAAFRFRKPEAVEVIGSFPAQTVAKPDQSVDLAVRIPKTCFHEKDFLNHRYHAKRILYLAVLERELRHCSAIESVEWFTLNYDTRKPILVLRLAADETGIRTKFSIRLLPSMAPDTFDMSKLGVGRNNVREAKNKEGVAEPTPLYNTGILEDMLIEELSSWLQNKLSQSAQMKDAICLAKVWLRQRSKLMGGRDGLSGFLMSVLMVHLSTPAGKSRITEHMAPLQVFRVTMEAIGISDVLGKGIYLQQPETRPRKSDALQLMKKSFDVIFCDPSGRLNLAHRMTSSALNELKEDAIRTVETLKASKDGGFDSIFMTPLDFGSKFDYHVRLDTPSSALSTASCSLDEERWLVCEKKVEALLAKALGERARLVRVMHRSLPFEWNPSLGLKCVGDAPIRVGVILSSFDAALRMADIGPNADDKEEAKKFRQFWGERSELRRFKDGKICETAVWEIEPWRRHVIIKQIVDHVLRRHLSLSSSAIKVTSEELDFALHVREKDQISMMPKILEALDVLSKRLRSIEDLPLKIVSVQPLNAVFRHTAVYCPQSHPLADEDASKKSDLILGACLDPLEIVVMLEGSGRWPDAPVAIQKTKLALCIKIAESMQRTWRIPNIASEDAVDLLMDGFAFRLNILYDRDPTHLNKERIASSIGKGRHASLIPISSASKQRVPSLKEDLLLRSLHASMLYGLHGVHHAYSPTVRLAKRWLASHLFAGALAEEAVELLVAHLFVKAAPYAAPSSRVTGLLRFFRLLSDFDWSLAPLVVDINGELTAEDEERIQAQFDSVRRSSGSNGRTDTAEMPAMYIATAYDMGSETWTKSSPTPKTLKRLKAYAKSSADLLDRMIMGGSDDTMWQSLFRTSLDTFDLVAILHQESLPHPSRVLFPGVVPGKSVVTKNKPGHVISLLPEGVIEKGATAARHHLLVGFDPVSSFVDELKVQLGDSCSIWYDPVGSDVIGFTMNRPIVQTAPEVRKVKRKKVQNSHVSDVNSLVNVIAMAGAGLVRSLFIAKLSAKKM